MIFLIAALANAEPVTRTSVEHAGDTYTVLTVNLDEGADIRLYGGRAGGLTFNDAASWAAREKRSAKALTAAAMFEANYSPVGLFVRDGEQLHGLNLDDGTGNFYMRPNGVFWLDPTGAHVSVSPDFPLDRIPSVRVAAQSGPMLVVDGNVHPAFLPGSSNRYTRSGVGVTANGRTVVFALSNGIVRLHDMATLFRDVLSCPSALYLDGIVALSWEGEGTAPTSRFGGVFALTVPRLEQEP